MDVESTAIRRKCYDAQAGKLLIRFVDSDEYLYIGAPPEARGRRWTTKCNSIKLCNVIINRYPNNSTDRI